MPKRLMTWLCLIAALLGAALGAPDPIITRVCGGFIIGSCIAMCLIERD